MIASLQTQGLQTLEQVRAFLKGANGLEFEAHGRGATYGLCPRLSRFRCFRPGKAENGLTVRNLCTVTGFSRHQMGRLIAQFHNTGQIRDRCGAPPHPFPRRYTI